MYSFIDRSCSRNFFIDTKKVLIEKCLQVSKIESKADKARAQF